MSFQPTAVRSVSGTSSGTRCARTPIRSRVDQDEEALPALDDGSPIGLLHDVARSDDAEPVQLSPREALLALDRQGETKLLIVDPSDHLVEVRALHGGGAGSR